MARDPNKPTPKQAHILKLLHAKGGGRRECFVSQTRKYNTYTWKLVIGDIRVTPRVERALSSKGWTETRQGVLKPGAEGMNVIQASIHGLREPDSVTITDAGRAAIGIVP